MPQNIAGSAASHTVIITRLRSMPSRTWALARVTLAGA